MFSGGQIPNGAKAYAAKAEGTKWLLETVKDSLSKEVITSFDQLALLKQADSLIQQSAKRLEKENTRVSKAVSSGLAIPFDRDKIELGRLELATKTAELQNNRQLLLLKLQHLTGLDTATFANIPHYVEPILVDVDFDVNDRSEVKALHAFRKATNYQLKQEKGKYLPTIGAFAGYSYSSLFNAQLQTQSNLFNRTIDLYLNSLRIAPNLMVGVALKWDLFTGFERHHQMTMTKLSAKQIDNKLEESKSLITLQHEKKLLTYQHYNRLLQLALQKAHIADNNNTLADKQYKAGLLSVTDRLAAETQIYQEAVQAYEVLLQQRQAAMATYQSAQQFNNALIVK